jgi:hypothetical protein
LQADRVQRKPYQHTLTSIAAKFLTDLLAADSHLPSKSSPAATKPGRRIQMRLIKMFGLTAIAAVAAMAFVGATSASAETSTQLCTTHTGLTCGAGNAVTSHHLVLASGTVGELLAAVPVLCLGILLEATPLGLGNPQQIHSLNQVYSGCGTGSAHNNCAITVPAGQQPLLNLLKTGLDEGTLTAVSGQVRLTCSNLGFDCLYDNEGMEFSVGNGHLTATETGTTELGGKFFCPTEGLLDGLFEALTDVFTLG